VQGAEGGIGCKEKEEQENGENIMRSKMILE